MAEHNEEKELEPFDRCGTKEEPIEVKADEVLNAIAEARNIYVRYAVISGDLDIGKIRNQLELDENGHSVIRRNIEIQHSQIREPADFGHAAFSQRSSFLHTTFSGDATFLGTTFSGDADFRHVTFSADADFLGATFNGFASFYSVTFSRVADFGDATMEHPADFSDVCFYENTVSVGLWNHILRPAVARLTKGKVKRKERLVTDFSYFNTTTVMDGSSNLYLKRYIDDEQWIASWKKPSKLRGFLFIVWELTCHCGRSFGLWAWWSAIIAAGFAFIYQGFGSESITFNVDKLNAVQPDFWGYLYYSIVTFTTLGFGDIVPLTNWTRLFVGIEVVLGYIMLGGLISIFANKLARRA